MASCDFGPCSLTAFVYSACAVAASFWALIMGEHRIGLGAECDRQTLYRIFLVPVFCR